MDKAKERAVAPRMYLLASVSMVLHIQSYKL